MNIYPIAAVTKNAEGKELTEMYDMFASGAVAFSDGTIGRHEERLMHLAGELLGIPQKELLEIRAKLQTPGGS